MYILIYESLQEIPHFTRINDDKTIGNYFYCIITQISPRQSQISINCCVIKLFRYQITCRKKKTKDVFISMYSFQPLWPYEKVNKLYANYITKVQLCKCYIVVFTYLIITSSKPVLRTQIFRHRDGVPQFCCVVHLLLWQGVNCSQKLDCSW